MAKNIQKEFPVYRTVDLTDAQKKGICNLFHEVFHFEKTLEHFEQQFGKASNMGSYHCIAEKNDKIIASFSYIPYNYEVDGRIAKFAVGVDTAVSADAKIGEFGVYFMFQALVKRMRDDNIEFIYGFPNNNFYGYNTHILGLKDIGILDFYVLPLALGQILPILRYFDPLINIFFCAICHIMKFFACRNSVVPSIRLIDSETFRNQRYDHRHHLIILDDGSEAIYMLYSEKKIGTVAYLVDLTNVSKYNLYEAFLKIAKKEKGHISMIAYPTGRLPFFSIFRIPMHFLPRKLHFVGKGLANNRSDDVYLALNNWKINLSNFDTR